MPTCHVEESLTPGANSEVAGDSLLTKISREPLHTEVVNLGDAALDVAAVRGERHARPAVRFWGHGIHARRDGREISGTDPETTILPGKGAYLRVAFSL